MTGIREYQGYLGLFTRDQVLGAYRNGSRVMKTATEPGDTHPIGATATVLGSVRDPELGIAYFVEWDDEPKLAVLVIAYKIAVMRVARREEN